MNIEKSELEKAPRARKKERCNPSRHRTFVYSDSFSTTYVWRTYV